jgi:hypothetical protein
MPYLALVGQSRQSARAWQNTQQRHFRQAYCRGTVIHQKDLVARRCQFVATTRAGAIDGREKFQPAMLAGVLQAVACLIGEFTEINLPRMRGFAEHEDVRTRTKDAIASASDDYRAHLRVFEPNPLNSVVKLNIDAQVIGIELELVAFAQPAVLIDFHRQRRKRRTLPVNLQRPVPVLVG